MNETVGKYLCKLEQSVCDCIANVINEKKIHTIVRTDLVQSHLKDKSSADFQKYYFLIRNNEKYYHNNAYFFREFKIRYSLQGIDNNYLDKLERDKKEILIKIRANNLTQLYFDTFNKALIKHGNEYKEKDLGSFFAKLVHTFRPEEYSALDNPIKNYFRLQKESFFLSFIIVSNAYKHWAANNKKILNPIREQFKRADKKGIIQHDRLTDLKLLDLIFWSKANR